MNFAVIPWIEALMKDHLFEIKDAADNPDNRYTPFLEMKAEFERRGDRFHTIDMYENLESVDWFLFFEQNDIWMERIIRAGKASRMVYCNAEPPAVYPWNSPEGYRKLHRYFPYIMTWNDQWIDNETVFKRNIPYYFTDSRGEVNWENRKLLTLISGNKHSEDVNELYSEREKVISYFEKKENEEFDFYGTGWETTQHPNYCGKVISKAETYQKYKFAICFENSKNLCGYITEKILDCFTSGIVPVYAGAPNVDQYIPAKAYINYFDFQSLDELDIFLTNVTEEQYEEYLNAADAFLNSDAVDMFSGKKYAEYIYEMIEQHSKDFNVSRMALSKLKLNNKLMKTKTGISKIIKKV